MVWVCRGEHETKGETTRKKNKKKTTLKSIIPRYMIEKRHSITCDNIEVIRECGNWRKLDAKQSLAILREQRHGQRAIKVSERGGKGDNGQH